MAGRPAAHGHLDFFEMPSKGMRQLDGISRRTSTAPIPGSVLACKGEAIWAQV